MQGACSVKDGAGFIRNELLASFPNGDPKTIETLRNKVISYLAKDNDKKEDKAVTALLKNEASYEQIRSQLAELLFKMYPSAEGFAYPWIEAVYDGFCVFCLGGALMRVNYTGTDAIKLSGEPFKVVRVTEYRTTTNSPTVS